MSERGKTVQTDNPPSCKRCLDVGWVCENHPDRPWSRDKPNGCECGAGDPCPDCNAPEESEQPRTGEAISNIDLTKDKGQVH